MNPNANFSVRRDANSVPGLIAVSSADGVSLVEVWADPVTHRLLVQSPGGTGSITVTDGVTTVTNVTTIDFTSGATVTDLGGGVVGIVATGSGGSPFQLPLSGGLNQGSFTWAVAPKAIVIDGSTYQKTQQDGAQNWTGTTTITLVNAPNPTSSIFAVS